MSGVSGFTANLNVDYRKPVTIPSVLMLRAEITKREGRKLWLTGQLTDPVLDSRGRSRNVFVEGTGLFLESVKT